MNDSAVQKLIDDSSDYLFFEDGNTKFLTGRDGSCVVHVSDEVSIYCSKFFRYVYDSPNVYSDGQQLEKMLNNAMKQKVLTDDLSSIPDDVEAEKASKLAMMRRRKTQEILEKQRKAVSITESALEQVSKNMTGKTELQVANMVNSEYADRGVNEAFLDEGSISIVHRNCTEPHRNLNNKEIRPEDLVIVDSGCSVDGYRSDITRTYCEKPSEEQRRLFEYVKMVQEELESIISAGTPVSKIQEKEEELAEKNSFDVDDNLLHLPGHGVGLSTHMQPRLSTKSDSELVEGEVLALEPAVYVEGTGGVRIEDNYKVEQDGCKKLSSGQEDLSH